MKDLLIEGLTKHGEVCGKQKGMIAGGMPVGVRITHIPTGVTVEATKSRHLHENRRRALTYIKNIIDD